MGPTSSPSLIGRIQPGCWLTPISFTRLVRFCLLSATCGVYSALAFHHTPTIQSTLPILDPHASSENPRSSRIYL